MVEQIITLAKQGTLASRRRIISELPNEPLVIDKLINEIAPAYGDRSSGYTRLIKIGLRAGDARAHRPARARLAERSDVGVADPRGAALPERAAPCGIAARVEYDGTEFAGFQAQPGTADRPGRAGSERSAASAVGQRIRIDGGGQDGRRGPCQRTGDRIHLERAPDRRRRCSVGPSGRCLPPDVAIGPLRRVAIDFAPRRAAVRREYRYTIWNGPRSPLRERYALGVRERLDVVGDGQGRCGAGRSA